MIAGLRSSGVEVTECHVHLWRGVEDRVRAASGGWRSPSFLIRLLRAYADLMRAYRRCGDYDVMVLGYPGQLDVPLGRVLTWLRRRPLVLDVFMSIYLIAEERGLAARHPATALLIRAVEKLALSLPDRLIQDTDEYVRWLGATYGLASGRFRLVPTGADDEVFRPIEAERDDGEFRVLYYGTFILNHGVDSIVEAARLLEAQPEVRFELVGEGPTKQDAQSLADRYGLRNVVLVDWLEQPELVRKIAESDVCLGAFGTTPQSMMTVQNKIYEALAMRKCVLTGWSPTVSRALTHGKHVWLCQRDGGPSLAQAILTLQSSAELRQSLAENGYQLFQEQYSTRALGAQFRQALEGLAG
jgi:glycosyltransferase involved in cell wall biosynthesis